MSIQKEQIEAKVTHKDILYYYLKDYYHGKNFKDGVFVHVPQISGEQKSPSFNIYYSSKTGFYRWKDWIGNDGSAFDLVMRLHNVNFPECLEIINRDMNLNLETEYSRDTYVKTIPKRDIPMLVERNYNYDIDIIPWTNKLYSFWDDYGTKHEVLDLYNTVPLKALFGYNKDNKPFYLEATESEPIYAYLHDNWVKAYRPLSKRMKWIHLGKRPDNYVFGMTQLPETGDCLNLVGGEKDVEVTASHDMFSIALNSESSSLSNYPQVIELIHSGRFKKNCIMYDNDKTGMEQMDLIVAEYPILQKRIVPAMLNGNDISDYYKNKYSNRLSK